MLTDYRECNKCSMFALCRGVLCELVHWNWEAFLELLLLKLLLCFI